MGKQIGKSCKIMGVAPSIILTDPKYAHNVASIVRLASAFGLKQVWYTGNRVRMEIESKGKLPREERMKGYKDVDLINFDYPFDQFENVVPVGVELRPNAENLLEFNHPENAVYVFGPEDGSLSYTHKMHCHRFVYIPVFHCLNLATSVSAILWDRKKHRYLDGKEEATHISEVLKEDRVWMNMGLHSASESV